jgi:glycogen operon protein
MISGGDEFGRTQQGNNNAYCQDNAISWYDWQWQPWQHELFAFTRRILKLRRDHPTLKQRFFFAGRPLHEGGPKDLDWLDVDGGELAEEKWDSPDTKTLGMFISGTANDDGFLIILHAGSDDQGFTLPGAPYGVKYEVVTDTRHSDASEQWCTAGQVLTLMPHSMVILRVPPLSPAN